MRNNPIRGRRVLHLAITAIVLLSIILPMVPARAQGPPLYPDLVTQAPKGLRITREWLDGAYHYLLRFDNTFVNNGGRLELTANLAVSREIYQNVYDQKIGGNRVVRTRIATDLIFHPQHDHFHIEGVAEYEIQKKNSAGRYLSTPYRGTKTSFCIIDYVRISSSARTSPQYEYCNASVQGLSAGWGDMYYSSLPEQWVDLGTSMLADGDYALQSTANPQRKLKETNTENNAGVTYFTIRNGSLVTSGQSPECTATPSNANVGDTVQISCTRLTVGTTVDFRWGTTVGPILDTVISSDEHKALGSVVIPQAEAGAHPIFAVVRGSGAYYGAVVFVRSTLTVSPTNVTEGMSVSYQARGYTGGETVSIRVDGTQVATKVAGFDGLASGSFTMPAAARGSHTITAVGLSSNATASAQVTTGPQVTLNPTHAHVQTSIGPLLSGFQGGEQVDLAVQGGPVLKTVQVNSTGSADGSATGFELPTSVAPGTATIVATGKTSGASATASLLVLAAGANTPTATSVPSMTPTTEPQLDVRRVTARLNLRSGPSTTFGIIEVLDPGTIVNVTGQGQSSGSYWYVPVQLQNGTEGWVADEWLQATSPTSTPVPSNTPTRTPTATPSNTPGANATATHTPGANPSATGTAGAPQGDFRRVTARLNFREGPTTSSRIIQVLAINTIVTVTGPGQVNGQFTFVPIRLSDGTNGWVAEEYLRTVAAPPTSTNTPTGGATTTMEVTVRLNLRSGPGTTYASTEVLLPGTLLTITGSTVSDSRYVWVPVRKSNGVTGWVASEYLRSVAGPQLAAESPEAEATATATSIPAEPTATAGSTDPQPDGPVRLDDAVLRWLPEIQDASLTTGVPAEIIAGVIRVTSGGDPNVTGENGSVGLMHVTPDEFASLGINAGWHDPATNIAAGSAVLGALWNSSGSIPAALEAYFGPGCTAAGYCGANFSADVQAWAATYASAIAAPEQSGYAILPAEWTAPPVAPYSISGEIRPVDVAEEPAEVADPPVEPTATTEVVAEEPTPTATEELIIDEPDDAGTPES